MKKKMNNHLVKDIPNNDKNRMFISELNKLAITSNSKYRYRIRYRKPINGYRKGYSDGCVPKQDASCFSVYIDDKTPYKQTYEFRMYERHRNEIKQHETEYELLENKHNELISKYNKLILTKIINQLKNDVDDLHSNMEKTHYSDLYSSLESLINTVEYDMFECEKQ